jgi:hypothetical protein
VERVYEVIESEPAESCLYVSGVLRKVVLVDLCGTISSGHLIQVEEMIKKNVVSQQI